MGIYRIQTKTKVKSWSEDSNSGNEYLNRLIRLIPSEVIGVFLAGLGVIPTENVVALTGWSTFGLIMVLLSRIIGTKDRDRGKPTQWGTVLISTLSFCVWLYVIGVPFKSYGIYIPWLSTLIMLGWTFIVPYVYKGEESDE